MKLITLSIIDGNWWATWHGPEAEKIKWTCGQTMLVTPFNNNAASEMVVAHIERLNPGYEVEVKQQQTKIEKG